MSHVCVCVCECIEAPRYTTLYYVSVYTYRPMCAYMDCWPVVRFKYLNVLFLLECARFGKIVDFDILSTPNATRTLTICCIFHWLIATHFQSTLFWHGERRQWKSETPMCVCGNGENRSTRLRCTHICVQLFPSSSSSALFSGVQFCCFSIYIHYCFVFAALLLFCFGQWSD